MKLLLDMYRSAPKEQRDKVQLMAAEKKAKSEVGEHFHPAQTPHNNTVSHANSVLSEVLAMCSETHSVM